MIDRNFGGMQLASESDPRMCEGLVPRPVYSLAMISSILNSDLPYWLGRPSPLGSWSQLVPENWR